MVRAIIESSLHVNDWVASDNAAVQGFFDTLLNWLAIFLRNHTTFNLVDKFEAFAWLVRLKLDPNVTILTTTTGLLDVLTLCFGGAADGFAISNLRSAGVSFNTMLFLEAVDSDFEMKLAHAGNNRLAGLFVGVDAKGRIFFDELLEAEAHFFLIGFGLWLNSDRYWRIWEGDVFEVDWMSWVANGRTGRDFLHANHGGDIASGDFGDFFTFISEHPDETADALFVAGRSVQDGAAGSHFTSIDADEDKFTNEWIGCDLEGKSGQRLAVVSFTDDLVTSLRVDTDGLALIAIERRR